MCDPKGIMPSFLTGRGQKRQQPCQCHVPQQTVRQRFDAASDTASKWVVGIAAVIVMAALGGGAASTAVGWTFGVVKIGLGVAAGLIVAAIALTVGLRVRKIQRGVQAVPLPAPLPARPRTIVTHVDGQRALPPSQAAAGKSLSTARMTATRPRGALGSPGDPRPSGGRR